YRREAGRAAAPFVDARGFSPSASFASSARELVTYARFHLGGMPGVLSDYSLRDMHRPHWVHPDWQGGSGLGCRVACIAGHTVSGHTGGYKGFQTAFTVCREQKLGVIVLTNSLGSAPWSYVERIYQWLLPELARIQPERPAADPAWKCYTGTYSNDWGDSLVLVRGGQLQLVDVDELEAPPAVLTPTDAPHTFQLDEPGNPLELAHFEFDEHGKVVRLCYRGEYAVRQKD
ncbi:MAG TPA: serine hydrolase, partial [Trueperaceae bacterium]